MNNKKSSSKKNLEGNRSKRSIFSEPVVTFRPPKCPKELPKEVKKIWKELAPDLISARKLNQFNASNFAEHCVIIQTLRDIDKMIYATCRSLLQEDRLYDAATGKETLAYKEAALSKMRRHYLILLDRSSKSFGFSAIQFEGHYRYDEGEKESELI